MRTIYKLDNTKKVADSFSQVYTEGMLGFSSDDLKTRNNIQEYGKRIFFEKCSNKTRLVCSRFVDDFCCFGMSMEPRSEVKLPVDILPETEYQFRFGFMTSDLKQEGLFFTIQNKSILDLDNKDSILTLGMKESKLVVSGYSSGLWKVLQSPRKEFIFKSGVDYKFNIDILLSPTNEGYLRVLVDDGSASILLWSCSEKTYIGDKKCSVRMGVCGKDMVEVYFDDISVGVNETSVRVDDREYVMNQPTMEKIQEIELSQYQQVIFRKCKF